MNFIPFSFHFLQNLLTRTPATKLVDNFQAWRVFRKKNRFYCRNSARPIVPNSAHAKFCPNRTKFFLPVQSQFSRTVFALFINRDLNQQLLNFNEWFGCRTLCLQLEPDLWFARNFQLFDTMNFLKPKLCFFSNIQAFLSSKCSSTVIACKKQNGIHLQSFLFFSQLRTDID